MSTRPDTIVERAGEDVDHEYVTDYSLDANGQVDPDSIVTTTDTIKAIVSQPSEQDEQRFDGRLSTGALKLTVMSDRDIQGDRGGRRDQIYRDGTPYEVQEVRDDENPLTGTQKQTVLVDRLGGRT